MQDTFLPAVTAARFLPKRARYFRDLKPLPQHDNAALIGLDRHGFTIVPNFVSDDQLACMREAWPVQEKFKISPEGTMGYYYPSIDEIPEFSPFFDDHRLRECAQGYIDRDAIQLRRSGQWKTHHGQTDAFEMFFHMDSWKHRLKAFLYLDTVTSQNGAMQYIAGSNRGSWRLPHEAILNAYYEAGESSYASGTESAFLGCLWPHQAKQLCEKFDLTVETCEAPAGSLLLFDTRGFHRARPLISGQRRLLMSYWIADGQHI